MSPAILATSPLWALAHEAEPVIPSRVIVLTTTRGRSDTYSRSSFAFRRFWRRMRVERSSQHGLAAEGWGVDGRLRFGATGDDIRYRA